ncbi:MAG: hypothetical protein JO190_07515 [Candidatus Eremiobacteraeota bacterium]|nr:hypothetical protein [Candidatus Eremiobacteraeota bacterium]MBV8531989.1 hypothetical protein [Candidatus Eremiobacteraeota bacterium]
MLRKAHPQQSHINPLAKQGQLAYVSDTFAPAAGNPGVYIYAWFLSPFNRGTLMGTLAGPLTEPFGACTAKNGTIWITNFNGLTGNGEIWPYAHGSVIPSGPPLIDAGNIPFSCAIDKKSGDLAVANVETTTGGSGSVYVYPGGAAPPDQFFGIPSVAGPLNAVNFVGYDPKGHLYADGSVAFCTSFTTCGAPFDAHVAVLESCCSSGSAFVPVTLIGVALTTIQWPGAIVWDGNGKLDVGDREAIPATSGGGCFSAAVGCGATYGTIEGGSPTAPTLTQKTLTLFSSTGSLPGLNDGNVAWGVATSGVKNIVPNTTGGGCVSPVSPFLTCTQVYNYPLGVSPVGAEWDFPATMETPAFAVVSQ